MRQSAERQAKYRAKILCIDPEPRVPEWVPAALRAAGYLVHTLGSAQVLLEPIKLQDFDLVIVDLSAPGQDRLKLLQALTGPHSSPPVIAIIDRETVGHEEELIKAGTYDCLLKPVSPVVLEHVLERTLSQGIMRRELEYLRSQWTRPLPGESVGISAGWSHVLGLIERAAATEIPVFIVGESGLGKGDAARLLHSLSSRSQAPFVRLNCARLSRNPFASEDFTRRNAEFAGAESDSNKFFHIAHGGTLFLDEVGSLTEVAQEKVLRLLQDGSVEVEGDNISNYVDVRLVASSSIELEAEAAAGRFNHAFFERINAMTIRIPPLRERVEDIPLLAAALLEKCATRLRKNVTSFHAEAMTLLETYLWPGNVRELRNVIERAVILADSSEITPSCLPIQARETSLLDSNRPLNLRAVLAAEEKKTLIEALHRANGVRREAARLLGIDPRNLVYFLRKYGLDKREERQ